MFFGALKIFSTLCIFCAILTLCNSIAGYLIFWFCVFAHTHIGRLRRKSVLDLPHRWKMLSKCESDPLSASRCKTTFTTAILHYLPLLFSLFTLPVHLLCWAGWIKLCQFLTPSCSSPPAPIESNI